MPPAVGAALFAGWTSSALPFYPTAWPLLLAACTFLLAYLRPRAGLALALVVPVFPLGNHAFGLAALYAGLALAWLVLSWRDPHSGLLCTAGPLLAPAGALGLLPLVVQPARGPVRRSLQAIAAVLSTAAVAGSAHVARLGIAETRDPLTAAGALWRTLLDHPAYPAQALAFGCAAAVLPFARARGPWAIAMLGAVVLAGTLAPTRAVQPLPIVLTTWAMCALLAAEPWLRTRVSARFVPVRVAAEA